MNLQVLMSVMNQSHDIVSKANIQSDAIIVNQCDTFKKEVFDHNGHRIQFLSFDERGVGLSRNSALMRADADIVLMSDDDVVYADGYRDLILSEFRDNPEADMIVFNVPSVDASRGTSTIRKLERVRKFNSLRYATYQMAFRREKILEKNIFFSLLFGGGAKYLSGEDSLFIFTVLGSGLKVYKSPAEIGRVHHTTSTWFEGYTDRYFRDRGTLYRSLSPRFYLPLIAQFVIRKHKVVGEGRTRREMFQLMREGAQR
ncbi:glycosyltransferase family A protein [Corynebacterium lubricantis]|uniref:glycosyltransferase family A protein n=1 Tax=Corynebacterium lubricantis TaxID=541095 RepID=UPI000373AE43|nr:glycosyltransferase family A protein [Corynebacterium lubricantis]